MNYALIENGIVANLIWLHEGNADEFPAAVAIGEQMVAIGDAYKDGRFLSAEATDDKQTDTGHLQATLDRLYADGQISNEAYTTLKGVE